MKKSLGARLDQFYIDSNDVKKRKGLTPLRRKRITKSHQLIEGMIPKLTTAHERTDAWERLRRAQAVLE